MEDNHRARGAPAEELSRQLAERGVHGVILSFVDTAGIVRVKAVPVRRLADVAVWGVGMSPVFDTFLADDSLTSTSRLGGPDGDLRLRPDLDRLTVLSGQPGWAWAPVDRFEQDGSRYAACQRGFARRMVDRAAEHGVALRMAVEVEWACGRSVVEDGAAAGAEGGAEDFVPATTAPAYGMTRMVELGDYARDVLAALEEQGLAVEQLHPEYSPGQFEVSVAAADPVAAADRSVLVRETIRAVSGRHGLRASFAPSVVAGQVGNGGHVHLSAWRAGENLFTGGPGPHGLTAAAEAFTAGILALLPALCAVGAPTVASYLRLVPSHWAGAYACWGHETRETALRLVTGTAGRERRDANLEVKCVDLAANPYLLVGALVAAGLHGLTEGLRLPTEVRGDPARFADADRAAVGAHRLPTSLEETADALDGCDVLRAAMGDTLFDAVVAVRRAEAERFRDRDPDEIVAATRWVY